MTRKKRERKEERALAFGKPNGDELQEMSTLLDEIEHLPGLPVDPRSMERVLGRTERLLEQQDIHADTDINAFMENYLATHDGALDDAPKPETPLGRAQEVMYDAFAESDHRKRMRLAKKALKTSPDCADAYVLLAEEQSADAWDAREWYEKGVEAGERALGEQFFNEERGNFWSILESRPYMRALEGVASTSWTVGDHERALAAYRRMLELNPNDNQGARYVLVDALLAIGADDELEALFEQYPEEGAASWLYSRALWTFRNERTGKAAVRALRTAVEHNPYVPLYMLGRRSFLSQEVPTLIGFGDESEAISYFVTSVSQWLKTPGAVDWLRENVDEQHLARIEQEAM